MADVTIRIDGQDDGAMALLRAIESGLNQITQANQNLTRATNAQAQAFRTLQRSTATQNQNTRQALQQQVQLVQQQTQLAQQQLTWQRRESKTVAPRKSRSPG